MTRAELDDRLALLRELRRRIMALGDDLDVDQRASLALSAEEAGMLMVALECAAHRYVALHGTPPGNA